MSKTRNLSDLLDANGDVKSTALDNVPASDVVNDTSPQLGGDLASNGNDILMADNDKIKLGTGNDLEIYHDGSNSIIKDAGTGNIHILADDFKVMNSSGTENIIFGAEDGTARLFHNNVTKFETTSSGATVTGTLTADGVSLGDSDVLNLGASNDLQISHDGNNSLIADTGTGDLFIRGSNNIYLQNAGGTTMSRLASGAGNYLYYNGSQKFETTSTGVSVTGDLSVSGNLLTRKFFGYGKTTTGSGAGWRTIDFNTEVEDDDSRFSHTSGLYTVAESGTYLLVAGHHHTNGAHSDYQIRIHSNVHGQLSTNASDRGDRITVSMFHDATLNEVLRVDVYHSNTAHSDGGGRMQFFGGYFVK